MNPKKFVVNVHQALYGDRPIVETLSLGITRGSIVAVVGEPGLSKSYLVLQLAVGLASCMRVLGEFIQPPVRPLRIAYFNSEDSTVVLQQRLHDIWRTLAPSAFGVDEAAREIAANNLQKNLVVQGWDGEDCDLFKEEATAFDEAIHELVELIDVLILDTFSDIFSGNENSTSDVRQFCNRLKRLAKKHQIAVVLVHHAGKGGGDGIYASRGSSVLPGKVRLQLNLSRVSDEDASRKAPGLDVKDLVWLSNTKSSYGLLSKQCLLRRDENGVLHAHKKGTSQTVRALGDPVESLSSDQPVRPVSAKILDESPKPHAKVPRPDPITVAPAVMSALAGKELPNE